MNCIEFLDDHTIAAGTADKIIQIWNIQSGVCVKTISNAHKSSILCVRLVDYNFSFACSSNDNFIKIWNIKSGELIKTLEGHAGFIRCMLKMKDNRLMSFSQEKTIKIWDLDNGHVIYTLNSPNEVLCVALLNSETIASGSYDTTISIWNICIKSAKTKKQLKGYTSTVLSLIVLSNDKLASGSSDKTIKIWNVETGAVLKTLTGHKSQIKSLALLTNSNLTSLCQNQKICIWDQNTGELVKTIDIQNEIVHTLITSKKGHLISCSWNFVKIWK